jgi:hypothetical protein
LEHLPLEPRLDVRQVALERDRNRREHQEIKAHALATLAQSQKLLVEAEQVLAKVGIFFREKRPSERC